MNGDNKDRLKRRKDACLLYAGIFIVLVIVIAYYLVNYFINDSANGRSKSNYINCVVGFIRAKNDFDEIIHEGGILNYENDKFGKVIYLLLGEEIQTPADPSGFVTKKHNKYGDESTCASESYRIIDEKKYEIIGIPRSASHQKFCSVCLTEKSNPIFKDSYDPNHEYGYEKYIAMCKKYGSIKCKH